LFLAGCIAEKIVVPTDPVSVSYPSCAAVADGHFACLDDNRNLTFALGQLQHPFQDFGVLFHIQVFMIFVGLPGPVGVRSPGFAENQDFFFHGPPRVVLNVKIKTIKCSAQLGNHK
jgi:hypothetical protein